MNIMFTYARAFNQPLGTWTLNAGVSMGGMLYHCGMDCLNYSATLNGWANNPATPSGRTLGAIDMQYGTNVTAARAVLTGAKGWTIVGDAPSGSACGLPAQPDEFIITVKTYNPGTSNGTSFTIPTTGGGYNYEVDWNNDGLYDQSGVTGNVTHDYGTAGIYTLRIRGDFPRIYFNNDGDHEKLLDVVQWGSNPWTSMELAFFGCSNLNITATDVPDLSGVTSMASMFRNCSVLNGPSNIGDWNTSSVTDMNLLFLKASAFNQPVGNWNTANVTSMIATFESATAFNQPIGDWNTGNVTDMRFMFLAATAFNQPIGGWDMANVTNMRSMLNSATAFNQPIGDWNTANVTNMRGVFAFATSFNQPIGNWNTANVTNMSIMFAEASAFNQPIGNWNTSAVTNMDSVFLDASAFNQPLGTWTLNAAVSLTDMLRTCGMDCTNYTATLNGWAANPATPSGRSLGALGRQYGLNAVAARATLTGTKGWTITGDAASGLPCPCAMPTFTACPTDRPPVNASTGQCSASVAYTVSASGDPAPALTYAFTGATTGNGNGTGSNSAFSVGVTTVTVTATSPCGGAPTCSFTVTVVDNQNPSITCPANIVRNTDANLCTAIVNYTTPTYSDNCAGGGTAIVPPSLPSGSAFPKGTALVSWKATDAAGLTAICQFSVTVNDAQAPTITCPANKTQGTDPNACTAAVTYATPTGTDNCGLPSGLPIWVSGGSVPTPSGSNSVSVFSKGINTVTWKATDAAGLTKTCTFRVTVNDTQAPTISCPSSQSLSTDANLCSAVANYSTPTAADNCTPPPTVVKTSGLASGSAFPKGNNVVVWRATDGAGLTKTCSFSITVTDAQLPAIACPADILVTGSGSPCTATVTYASPTASDNCAVQSVFLLSGLSSGSQFPAGVTNVVWRAVDNSGLSATCAFTVTVGCGTSAQGAGDRDGAAFENLPSLSAPELRLWPNPAVTQVQISIENLGEKGGDLTVLDAQGRTVWQRRFGSETLTSEGVTLDVSGEKFAAGVYFVTLRAEGKMVTKRLIVQRY